MDVKAKENNVKKSTATLLRPPSSRRSARNQQGSENLGNSTRVSKPSPTPTPPPKKRSPLTKISNENRKVNVFNQLLELYGDSPEDNDENSTESRLNLDAEVKVATKTYAAAQAKAIKAKANTKPKRTSSRPNKENSKPISKTKPDHDLHREVALSKEEEEVLDDSKAKTAKRSQRKKTKLQSRKIEIEKEAEEWVKQKNLEFDSIDTFPLCVE